MKLQTSAALTAPDGTLPVSGDDALQILENDHRAVKGLLMALPRAESAERARLLEELKSALTIHNATEENIVYPAIHDIAQRPMHAGRLYHQQDEAKVLVWELSQLDPSDAQFTKKAERLRDAVLAHVEDEETSEFPQLREVAGDKLSSVTQAVRDFRRSLRLIPNGT